MARNTSLILKTTPFLSPFRRGKRRGSAVAVAVFAAFLPGCSASEIKPVDIFPEDACAQCKMAFSDQAFASEVIAADGVAYKFDDIGCMDKFKKVNADIVVGREFYKNYGSKQWLSSDEAVVIETGIKTPMGSGKVAVRDSSSAYALLRQYPKTKELSVNSQGCGNDCCGGKTN